MPLTFLQAKAIVSPDAPVVPGTKAHRDILEMMRQSGKVFAEDNVTAPAPRKALRPIDFERYQSRVEPPKRQGTSKKAWLSIDANRQAYEQHLKDRAQIPVGYYEPEPPTSRCYSASTTYPAMSQASLNATGSLN